MKPVYIAGCGYVGLQVARQERSAGRSVSALVRAPDRMALLQAAGINALHGDLDDPASLVRLPEPGALVYYFAPPPERGNTDPRLQNFLTALTPDRLPARFVLISTSGVYGDCQGATVTETRAPHPLADRARRRLDAETRLQAWADRHGVPAVILRVPGIYGPGRLPTKRLLAGEPVLREQESPWSNRVHVHDLVRACVAAGAQDGPGGIYNISDGHPTTMTDYFNQVADALGLARPPQISLAEARVALGPGMLSYLAESKRLDNRRMREQLGVEPRYPDLAQGIAASLASETAATVTASPERLPPHGVHG